MKRIAIAALGCMILMGPAYAVDHGCGTRPATPEMFDPQTATKEQVLAIKAAFEAYQAENTTYLDCIEAYSKSDAFASMDEETKRLGVEEMNAELRAVQTDEQAYADTFNENARIWVDVQNQARQNGN